MLQYWRLTVVVTAIAATSFFAALGSIRLWDEDEPKNAVCGQEMFARGDWVVPTFNDRLRTDKPILIYWCMIAVYHVLGVTELAARFPSALAGVGTVVLTLHLGRLMFGSRAGLLASCLLSSGLMFAVLARGATPDSLLIVCITASLASFVAGVAARRGGHFNGTLHNRSDQPTPVHIHGLPMLSWIGMYVAMGLAVLAKGPIGVVMPIGITGAFLLFFDGTDPVAADSGWLRRYARFFAPSRILRVIMTLRLGWGLAIVAIVALPWYILVAMRTDGEWITGFLGTHNVTRFMQPMEHHRGLPIYYIVAILLGFFPGSLFLPVALWSTVTSARRSGSQDSASAFLICWIGCYVGFFTLAATKLPNYVVPCYPALAIATGAWLSSSIRSSSARDWRLWLGYISFIATGVGAAIALAVVARSLFNMDPLPALPGVVAVVGGTVSLLFLYKGRVGGSIATFAAACLAFTLTANVYTAGRINPLQEGPLLAEQIHRLGDAALHDEPHIATLNYFTPSLVYYVGHPVHRLKSADEVPTFFDQGGDALAMPRAVYEKERAKFPQDVSILAAEPRFLKKHETVVLIGRSTEVARGDNRERTR
jgi:4-amino-4-deoxy-L-arabinose transferase-like glycosyltransferase